MMESAPHPPSGPQGWNTEDGESEGEDEYSCESQHGLLMVRLTLTEGRGYR